METNTQVLPENRSEQMVARMRSVMKGGALAQGTVAPTETAAPAPQPQRETAAQAATASDNTPSKSRRSRRPSADDMTIQTGAIEVEPGTSVITTRVDSILHGRLFLAMTARKLAKQPNATLQEIAIEAFTEWLERHRAA